MNNDYLRGVIDATVAINKLAGIKSNTIDFGISANRITAILESETKTISAATYWKPREDETVFYTEHHTITPETPVSQIIDFITTCTEQAQKDEYNNL